MLPFAFGIHAQLCEELVVIMVQNLIQLLTEEKLLKKLHSLYFGIVLCEYIQ